MSEGIQPMIPKHITAEYIIENYTEKEVLPGSNFLRLFDVNWHDAHPSYEIALSYINHNYIADIGTGDGYGWELLPPDLIAASVAAAFPDPIPQVFVDSWPSRWEPILGEIVWRKRVSPQEFKTTHQVVQGPNIPQSSGLIRIILDQIFLQRRGRK